MSIRVAGAELKFGRRDDNGIARTQLDGIVLVGKTGLHLIAVQSRCGCLQQLGVCLD